MAPTIEAVGKTDVGLVRSGNEDYLHMDESNGVYAVCDGMGGHQAGEVASMTAAETIKTAFSRMRTEILEDDRLHPGRTLPPAGELLLKAIRLANRAIYNVSRTDSSVSGMGTTIVAVALEADIMSVAHVGDSRGYRIADNKLEPLTRDHSWVAEMEDSQHFTDKDAEPLVGKNIITRALGVRESVEVDCRIVKVKPGDVFMLCSDGLCGFATDEEMFKVVQAAEGDLKKITDDLIQMANDRGGTDNVTVVTLKVVSVDDSPLPEIDVFTLGNESPELLAVEDSVLEQFRPLESEAATAANESVSDGADTKGGNKFVLISIFVLFMIVAAAILYYSQHQ